MSGEPTEPTGRRSWATGEHQTAVGAAALMGTGAIDPEAMPYVTVLLAVGILGRHLFKAATAVATILAQRTHPTDD